MRELENLKEAILKDPKEFPRLEMDTEFQFSCHPGVACFNQCCADVNIFLTPYDILRLKNRLGITSEEFLSKYTIIPFDKNIAFPVVLLKMQENEKKSCHFVTEKGCGVYEDRPWACRMYPVGLASPAGDLQGPLQKEFYFLLQEKICKGFGESKKQTLKGWLDGQGIHDYNEIGEMWKDLTLHPYLQHGNTFPPQKIEMFFTAAYNLDKFREFVFESTFLKKFVVEEDVLKKIKEDDVELLKFGFRWLRFALFGEKTMKVNDVVMATKESELKAKGKIPKK
ncbi:MAG TPA: YkgJ family cysteine cluster protein [candidate division Zixibacteria bacterium]|nr:YkgJ family cysteine cluster protein [candidate division Zixibacteria bacterium]